MKSSNTFFGLLVFSVSSFLNLPLLGEDEYVGYSEISITSTYAPTTESRYNADYDSINTQAFLSANSSTLLVTAQYSDQAENGVHKDNCGSLRVLKLNDGIWTETFARSGNFEHEYLGSEADMSADGQTIAVQSSRNDSANIERVIVYTNEDGEWSQKGSSITISSLEFEDRWTANFAMDDSGSRIIVGDALTTNPSGSSGSFTIYDFIDDQWVSQGTFENSFYDSIGGSYFSYNLDISGDGKTIISSLYGSNDNNIFIYKLSDGLWSLSEQLNVGNIGGYQADESIKLNGDGSTFVASRSNSGVRVYKSTGSEYQQLGSELTGDSNSGFGYSSVINDAGNIILVGSPNQDNYHGMLQLFSYINGDWQQQGKTSYGEYSYSYLGRQVSLSSSGQSFVSNSQSYSSRHSRGVYGFSVFDISDFSITRTAGSYTLNSANSSVSGNIELP